MFRQMLKQIWPNYLEVVVKPDDFFTLLLHVFWTEVSISTLDSVV